jgi:putative Mg2+ transporter-C (MgtC) family protein
MLGEFDILARFIASTLAGVLIGFVRRHKPAGIRTFALLCLGSTIFTVVSTSNTFVNPDQGRVIAQIVAGIGFLGLGVIWRQGPGKPTGLTTAAAIWTTAAIGILIGLGMWFETAVGSVLVLLILLSKKPLVRAHIED